jgi:NAD-dependent SIR2 family protein deacetylase
MEEKNQEVVLVSNDELAKRRAAKKSAKQKEEVIKVRLTAEEARLTCIGCKHRVEDEEDWTIGVEDDSGIHVCPKCNTYQPHTMLDGLAQFRSDGQMAGIHCFIPMESLDELNDAEPVGDGQTRFRWGIAVENALKKELINHYGVNALSGKVKND